jgi:hypothetical protein
MCPVFVASGTYAVHHNKETDLQFKAQENYVDKKMYKHIVQCKKEPKPLLQNLSCALASSIMCSSCTN